jgi:hypothetical protein
MIAQFMSKNMICLKKLEHNNQLLQSRFVSVIFLVVIIFIIVKNLSFIGSFPDGKESVVATPETDLNHDDQLQTSPNNMGSLFR